MTTGRTGYYNFYLKLPDGLTCSQCVLQWKYHAGNLHSTVFNLCTGCLKNVGLFFNRCNSFIYQGNFFKFCMVVAK